MYGAVKLHNQLQFIGEGRLCSLPQYRLIGALLRSVNQSPIELQSHTWGSGKQLRICPQNEAQAIPTFLPGKARAVTRAKAGVMRSPAWHLDPEVHKKCPHILYFPHARVDVVRGNFFTDLTVWSQQHIGLNIMGFCLLLTTDTGVLQPQGWQFNVAFMSHGTHSAFRWQILWENG